MYIYLIWCACVHTKSLQSCTPLCDPLDSSPPGFSVYGILQARILEWVACPPPGALPNPGIKPISLMSPKLAGRFFTTSTTWEALFNMVNSQPKYWSINFSISSSNEYSGLISLDRLVWSPCSPRDSQEFYVTLQFESIISLALNLFYDPILTSIHDYRKSHSFDYIDPCLQSNASASLYAV